MKPATLAVLLLMMTAACSAPPAEPWVTADGKPPAVAEVGDCHAEARRLATQRYPDQVRRDQGSTYRIEDPDRFPAHIRFFEQCMRRKGFARATAPATPRPA